MKPYSNDLRQRIVEVYESGGDTQEEGGNLFGVCTATIRNLRRRKRETGATAALPHAGGREAKLDAKARQQVPALVKAHDDATLAELGTLVAQQFQTRLSPAALC